MTELINTIIYTLGNGIGFNLVLPFRVVLMPFIKMFLFMPTEAWAMLW